MKIVDETYIFETPGRKFYAHRLFVPINPDLTIKQVYDGNIEIDNDFEADITGK